MGILNQEQFARLAEALAAGFDSFTLDVLVAKRIHKGGLESYVTRFAPFDYQATMLARRAETDDFTAALIHAARESRPRNETFAALALELGLTALGPRTGETVRLEAEVRKSNRFHDFAMWRMALTEIESRVCSITLQGTRNGEAATAYATGFLVGPDSILTNFHAVAPLLAKTASGFEARREHVVVKFDYKRLRDRVLYPGDEYLLAEDWSIDVSPVDELDYALVRLAQKAGERPVAGWSGITDPPLRGWFRLEPVKETYAPHTPLLIAQHPSGDPLQFAYDTDSIIEVMAGGTRLRHRTNTSPGSSGAPYFNAALELIGIHHAGDLRDQPDFNQGIPINPIIERIGRKLPA